MIILGIDPGTAATGYGIIKSNASKITYLHHGCVTTDSRETMPHRLGHIFDELNEQIRHYQANLLVMESIFFFANAKSVISVGQAMGAIMLAAQTNGINVVQYSPLMIKRRLCGYGRASKPQIQSRVLELLDNLEEIPRPQHAADALAAALCHLIKK